MKYRVYGPPGKVFFHTHFFAPLNNPYRGAMFVSRPYRIKIYLASKWAQATLAL